MAINLKSTGTLGGLYASILLYGQPGTGKTMSIRTLPQPVVLSAEGGLLSLQDSDTPYIEIGDYNQLAEAIQWLQSSAEATPFQSVAVDSISEIAEVILNEERKITTDPRRMYPAYQDKCAEIIRTLRSIPKHLMMTAKAEKSPDEEGRVTFAPMMPGNKAAQSLPYFFDEVLALRVEKTEDGQIARAIQCMPDGTWTAKDRSGRLEHWEQPDLCQLINKITGQQQ